MVAESIHRLRQQANMVWSRYRTTLIGLSVTLLGAGLRLYNIGANSFNLDEAWALWLAQHDASFIFQLTTLGGEDVSSPPLFYMLLRGFTLIGEQPLVVRMPSVLAGTLMVWLTFRLAVHLFDLRVAALGALLIAVAPTHIVYSRVARAYMLGALLAFLSLYLFARLLYQKAGRWSLLGLVAATAAATWTHYLTFLVVLFEYATVTFLWVRRRLARPMLTRWLVSQVVLGFTVLPVLLAALSEAPAAKRHSYMTRPGLQSLVKSAILFSTGDPSYGPTDITAARAVSLVAIVSLCILGLWVFVRRGYHRRLDDEGRRLLFLVGAIITPWLTAFVVSQVRPLYGERYLLYIMPPLFILFAWVFVRARNGVIASFILLSLIGLTVLALRVYYTEPWGEEWREAVASMRPEYQAQDLVVVAPGWYARPFAYYFYGTFPKNAATLEHAPAIFVENGEFRVFTLLEQTEGIRASDPALAEAQRVWFLSGYSPVDPAVLKWIEQDFEPLDIREFVGARVYLL
ncbi:MAG: hypothetical protein AMJ93_14665, partial [Anaerolineae bacterium SM23_84]